MMTEKATVHARRQTAHYWVSFHSHSDGIYNNKVLIGIGIRIIIMSLETIPEKRLNSQAFWLHNYKDD